MFRIGQSIDIHNLREGRKIWIGGIQIETPYEVVSVSDGDVLLHAVSEAIIGALGCGDLGEYFSDTDPENKNLDSKVILNNSLKLLKNASYEIVNIDTTIICEQVYLGPHKIKIRKNLAALLRLSEKQVNVKATRWENKKNFQIQAHAVVLLRKINK